MTLAARTLDELPPAIRALARLLDDQEPDHDDEEEE
jgi:hypothetical protein